MLHIGLSTLINFCPELAVVANLDSAIENAIFNGLSFHRLAPSKCRRIRVPSQSLSRKGRFWTATI